MTNRAVAVRATSNEAPSGAVGLALVQAARDALAVDGAPAPVDPNARAPFVAGARPTGWGFRSARNG